MRDALPGSDIRIDTEGSWFYRDTKMTRHEIVILFYEHLERDASGRYLIRIGSQRCVVNVDDTAYVVWALRWAGTDASEDFPVLSLSDGSTEKLDPGTLRVGEGHVLYCGVKNGRFEARFSRSAYYALAEHLHYDPANDVYFISLKNQRYPLVEAVRFTSGSRTADSATAGLDPESGTNGNTPGSAGKN